MRALALLMLCLGCSGSGVDTTLTTLARRPAEFYCGWEKTGTITLHAAPGTCWLVVPRSPRFASTPANSAGPCDGIMTASLVYPAGARIDVWVSLDGPAAAGAFDTFEADCQ